MSAVTPPDLLARYRPLLAAIEGLRARRLRPPELFRIAQIVQAAEASDWQRVELCASLASALTSTEEDWDKLVALCERHLPRESVTQPEQRTQAAEQDRKEWKSEQRQRRRKWLRRYWSVPVLGLCLLSWLAAEVYCARQPAAVPRQELCLPRPVVVEKPAPQSRYEKRCQPIPPDVKIEQRRPVLLLPTGLGMVGKGIPGLLLGLVGGWLLLLWQHRLRLRAAQAAQLSAEELRRVAERAEQEERALAEVRKLEREAKAKNLPMQSPYRMKLDVPLRPEDVEDCATELGRVYEHRKGSALHIEKTLHRTMEAGGRPQAEYVPQRSQREIVVLMESEQSRPYVPGFLQLVTKLRKLGVRIVLYRFALSPSELRSERGGGKLSDVLKRHDGAAVVLFGKLQTRAKTIKGWQYLPWIPAVLSLPWKAWIDPDPKPPCARDKQQIDEEKPLAKLRRFPMTGEGLVELGRYLQGEVGESRKPVDWEPLPSDAETHRQVKLWLAIGSQVPDASWEQFEGVRQKLFKAALPDARSVGLLIEEFQRLLGRRFATTSETIELEPQEQIPVVAYLQKESLPLFLQGLALFDEALGSEPPGGDKLRGTLLHAEWLGRKARLEALRLEALHQKQAAQKVLQELLGTAADERVYATLQLVDGLSATSGQWTPQPKRQWQIPRLAMQSAAAAVMVAAMGVLPWWLAKRSGAVEAALHPLARPVQVTREQEPQCRIERIESFAETKQRPALIAIPKGRFQMGSPADEKDRFSNEKQHWVELTQPYLMMETEVTQGQYQAVMGENPSATRKTNYVLADGTKVGGDEDCKSAGVSADRPVYCVDFQDAAKYANRLSALEGLPECYLLASSEVKWEQQQKCKGYRLPTEAEWEYAARAGKKTVYAGSDNADEVAWYDKNSKAQTQPVRGKKPNDWKLYDLSGNVWEWVWDWHGDYPEKELVNPTGPPKPSESVAYRVVRGGSWRNVARWVRVAYRAGFAPAIRSLYQGFRLVRSYP